MFKNQSVKTRLQLGFAVVSGLFLSILLVSGVGISRLVQDVQTINEKTMPNALLADEMNLSRSDVQQFLTDVSATHDAEGFDAAEEAARMLAMDNASRNADDLIDDLTLTANKVRQSTITSELMDIVGGAAGIK